MMYACSPVCNYINIQSTVDSMTLRVTLKRQKREQKEPVALMALWNCHT